MLNYTGTGRTDYEEVFRALGLFIDQNNLKEVVIPELKEGFLLKGLAFSAERSGFQTISQSYLFTDQDIEKLVEAAFQQRGQAAVQGAPGGQPGGQNMPQS